jgi:hypothetical protein
VLEEAEAMLDEEAAGVPVPEVEQVVGERPADPGEPERLGRLRVPWQPLDLHPDEGEGGVGCSLDV